MNRTYFEPKQPNIKSHDDEANLLKLDTDTEGTDDDVELGKIKCDIEDSPHHIHQSLIDRTEQPLDLDATNRCYEFIKATAFRIKQSVQFFLLYLALIILNAFVLIWELSDGADRKICIILEGIITLMFMGEVAVQIITEEWSTYWSSWLNRIDLIVCVLCVFLYIIFASIEDAPHNHYSVGNYMDALIVGLRYGMQAIRLLRFAQRGRENRQMLNQTEVKFNNERTLSVLHLHGVQMSKRKKKKKQSSSEDRQYSNYASSLQKWSHNMNKLFNPNFNVLLYGVNSNELRGLKEKSATDSIEMIDINGKTQPHGSSRGSSRASSPLQDHKGMMESPQLSQSEEVSENEESDHHRRVIDGKGNGKRLRNGKGLQSDMVMRRRSSADRHSNDVVPSAITGTPEHQGNFSEAYTTDEVEENHHQIPMHQIGFMYDSEQMALYDNILQNEETDDTMGPITPNRSVVV